MLGEFTKLFGGTSHVADELAGAASKIDKVLPGAGSISGAGKLPLETLSGAGSIETKALFRNIQTISRNKDSASVLLQVAKDVGYKVTSIDDLLIAFSKEFSEMITAMNKLPDSATTAELDTFYAAHTRSIDFFRQLKTNSEIKTALSTGLRGADRALDTVRPAKTFDEVRRSVEQGGSRLGYVMLVGKTLLPLAVIGGGVAWMRGKIIENGGVAGAIASLFGVTQTPESEDHLKTAEDAIACLDSISVLNGTGASKLKALVRENLIKFIELKNVNTYGGDREKIGATFVSALDAGIILAADAQTEGSIQSFIAYISEHSDELEGFSKWQVAGAGAGIVAAGLMTGGAAWWVTLLGASAAAGSGFYFMSQYYDEELNCLRGGIEAIVAIETKLHTEKDERTQATTGPEGGETPIKSPEESLLVKILSVMQNKKLAGIPGLEFVNEMNMTQAIISGSGGIENAAVVLSNSNTNIAAYIGSVENNESTVVDLEFVKQNKPLIDTIYITMHSIFKNALRGKRTLGIFNPKMDDLIKYVREYLSNIGYKFTSAKNNENKMKKHSIPTNSTELVRKAAETKVSYFSDANLGLKDQLTKAYYTGLTGMYNEQPPKKTSDYKDFYGIQNEPKENIVLLSHPKSITLADSMGKGGLVENGLEQKEQSHYVATKTPSGNFQSKYATTISYLVKLSKAAEEQGKKEVTELIKQTIKNLK